MSAKEPKEFSIEEVCMWLTAIGLGAKMDAFKDNAIDGGMLVTLTGDDLSGDLGLTNLQARKFQQALDFSNGLASGGGDQSGKIASLESENARLRAEIADLKAAVEALSGPQTTAAARPPAAAPAPPPRPQKSSNKSQRDPGAPVLRGAAGGAARGAVLGAIGGAIAGDAGKGAKIGAAMGGTSGGMQGLAARRRARRQARW